MIEPGHYTKPPFTDEQMDFLEKIFVQLGMEIKERANHRYCNESSASKEAINNVGSTIQNFQPQYVDPPDDLYEGN